MHIFARADGRCKVLTNNLHPMDLGHFHAGLGNRGDFRMAAQNHDAGQHRAKQHQQPEVLARRQVLISEDGAKQSQARAAGAECEVKLFSRAARYANELN